MSHFRNKHTYLRMILSDTFGVTQQERNEHILFERNFLICNVGLRSKENREKSVFYDLGMDAGIDTSCAYTRVHPDLWDYLDIVVTTDHHPKPLKAAGNCAVEASVDVHPEIGVMKFRVHSSLGPGGSQFTSGQVFEVMAIKDETVPKNGCEMIKIMLGTAGFLDQREIRLTLANAVCGSYLSYNSL
ncbi:MAG: hypothetical protein HQL64_02315 [Magnetococcales bacterium]|nr:hypothetical protein [Magnetococcales bacterium]